MGSPYAALLAVLLLVSSGLAAPGFNTNLDKRQAGSSKYCNPSGICFLEWRTAGTNPVFRIAMPDASSVPFDTILEIITPVSLTWTGFGWGGSMSHNPLTVVWPNGNQVTVSSRYATARALPAMYSSATYKTLRSSRNTTHWSVEVACTGCSRWSGVGLTTQLRPAEVNTFAWAVSRQPVSQPASASSNFIIHHNVGMFSRELSSAKNPSSAFQEYIRNPPVF